MANLLSYSKRNYPTKREELILLMLMVLIIKYIAKFSFHFMKLIEGHNSHVDIEVWVF